VENKLKSFSELYILQILFIVSGLEKHLAKIPNHRDQSATFMW